MPVVAVAVTSLHNKTYRDPHGRVRAAIHELYVDGLGSVPKPPIVLSHNGCWTDNDLTKPVADLVFSFLRALTDRPRCQSGPGHPPFRVVLPQFRTTTLGVTEC
jgi:hypothetical protein